MKQIKSRKASGTAHRWRGSLNARAESLIWVVKNGMMLAAEQGLAPLVDHRKDSPEQEEEDRWIVKVVYFLVKRGEKNVGLGDD